jgi:serine/threonine-protein kinase
LTKARKDAVESSRDQASVAAGTSSDDDGEETEVLPGREASPVGLWPDLNNTGPSSQQTQPDPPRLNPGQRLADRFLIIRSVASGGMGEVYEAQDEELQARVAVKTILPSLASDPGAVDRFRREVLLARRVSHPNVCRVNELYSVEGPGGEPLKFLTMEFLDGESLAQRLKRVGRFSTREALSVLRQMVAALDAAHAQGIVHRDFKPGNVMLVPQSNPPDGEARGDEVVKVTDFGIARALALASEDEATHGTRIGTPRYMAPEQMLGAPVTPATDVYALGVVMHEMIAGKPPDTARVVPGGSRPFKLATLTSPRLESRWTAAVERCQAREPERRFQRVQDVLNAVEPPAWSGRRRAVAAALLAISALTVLVWRELHRPRGVEPIATLAVLPFRAIGAELGPRFGLGLADALIGRLATSRSITIRPTSAVDRFEGKPSDAIEAGRQLGVGHVVDGSIQQVEGNTRVQVQLTDVARRGVVWKTQLDLPPGRLFELEDTISTRLFDRLDLKLAAASPNAPGRSTPVSDRLVDGLLAARAKIPLARSGPEQAGALVAQLNALLAEEPRFAEAVALRAYAGAYKNYYAPTLNGTEAVLRDVEHALSLDPDQSLPHIARAFVFYSAQGGWKSPEAIHELRTAVELSPGLELAHLDLERVYLHRGWVDRAEAELDELKRVDPLSVELKWHRAGLLMSQGHYREATELIAQVPPDSRAKLIGFFNTYNARLRVDSPGTLVEAIEARLHQSPKELLTLGLMAIARTRAGATSIAELEAQIMSQDQQVGHFHHSLQMLAVAHALRGETAIAVEQLRRASEAGFPCLPCFDNDPLLERIHPTAEYVHLREVLQAMRRDDEARLEALENAPRRQAP